MELDFKMLTGAKPYDLQTCKRNVCKNVTLNTFIRSYKDLYFISIISWIICRHQRVMNVSFECNNMINQPDKSFESHNKNHTSHSPPPPSNQYLKSLSSLFKGVKNILKGNVLLFLK